MHNLIRQNIRTIEWLLGAFAVFAPIAAWLSSRNLAAGISIYDIFPPLGLVAFGLMWTHFVMGALRRYADAPKPQRNAYMQVSMGMVLGLIVLHPILLWVGLYRDGYGLPPESYLTAYSTQVVAVLLGSMGLAIFLAFELKRWFGDKKWWRYVELAQIVGMAAIFYHALELGQELRQGWFTAVWWLYGITLVWAVVYTGIYKKEKGE